MSARIVNVLYYYPYINESPGERQSKKEKEKTLQDVARLANEQAIPKI